MSIVYIGIDVHKESFSLYALNKTTGQVYQPAKIAADVKLVQKYLQKIQQDTDTKLEFKVGYEAGCWGYSLYDQMRSLGIACDILAPSTMYSSAKNKMVKNDKQDAKMIANNLANGTYKSVHVPDQVDARNKQFMRMFKREKKNLKQLKQTTEGFLLSEGYVYNKKHSGWTNTYVAWLRTVALPPILREILDEYLYDFDFLSEKIARLERRIQQLASSDRYRPAVSALRCFKGIETFTALTLQVEITDFSRFPNAKAFASYLGLTPSESSSGNKISHGAITKQGNSIVRSALIESAQSLVKGKIHYKGKTLLKRQQGQRPEVIAYADRARERLCFKFQHLFETENKPYNVAITAVARELAGFIWGMETGHIQSTCAVS